jgi:hypothetical protein
MSKFTEVQNRWPSNMPRGKTSAVAATLELGLKAEAKRQELAKHVDLSQTGREKAYAKFVMAELAPQLAKSKRQLNWHDNRIATQRATIRTKVVGEPDALDAERRAVLRAMSEPERIQTVLRDGKARAAALRGDPLLAGVAQEILDRAFAAAVTEIASDLEASLKNQEAGQAFHKMAIEMVTNELKDVSVADEKTGATVPFEKALAALPEPARHITSREEIEVDATE